MAAKILKYAALPAAVVGVGSFRIYSVGDRKSEELISPKELSIYSDHHAVQFVEERSVLVETGLGALRVGLQPYVRAVQNGLASVKTGVVSAFQAGEALLILDTYHFLRDPPPGFLPRVGIITVSGLGGLILARKGSRLKKILFPFGLATLGTAVCYPIQTVGVLKITGKKLYSVGSSAASMFQSKPKGEIIMPAGSMESAAPVTIPDPVSLTPESELAPVIPAEEVTPLPEVVPAVEFVSEIASSPTEPENAPELVEKAIETVPEPPVPYPVSEITPADTLVDTASESAHEPTFTETVSEADVTLDVSQATPSSTDLEAPAPGPATLSEEIIPSEQASATPPPADLASADEVPPPVHEATPPSPAVEAPPSSESLVQQVNVETAAVKSHFVPDPALVDHGQANPEDADMYSTRS
ncbi:MICOS complex subunit MIC27 [Triplophysa tibetana]|uniref:MICOS complex subunit n=1 Tax=Triplophysa tibetana TaxID=1572043 RepID=A0A5A9P4G1_9TELE|nr:MICOS complex subunit MIC27 [Triplophysa tibetana]